MEMNYCRRCGQPLAHANGKVYKCPSGHTLYANASPTVGVLFVNDEKEVLIAIRKEDPGKGKLDMPGGFCDGLETFEAGLNRELKEELGLDPDDFNEVRYLLSHNDTYDYQGEVIPLVCVIFTARLKAGAKPKPSDDVADVQFMKYNDIDPANIQFPSLKAGLALLHQRGII